MITRYCIEEEAKTFRDGWRQPGKGHTCDIKGCTPACSVVGVVIVGSSLETSLLGKHKKKTKGPSYYQLLTTNQLLFFLYLFLTQEKNRLIMRFLAFCIGK